MQFQKLSIECPSKQQFILACGTWSFLASRRASRGHYVWKHQKAWESWLIESGYPISKILASQGHDMNTSMKHYYNNDVTTDEREAMKKETAGWM